MCSSRINHFLTCYFTHIYGARLYNSTCIMECLRNATRKLDDVAMRFGRSDEDEVFEASKVSKKERKKETKKEN